MAVGFQSDVDLSELRSDGEAAVASLLARHRPRLLRMIALRLDPRLLSKIDSEDVVQESFVVATRRISEYLDNPSVPFFVWLRQLAHQAMIDAQRRFLGTQMRDVRHELTPVRADPDGANSGCPVSQLADSLTSPSQCAVRRELLDKMRTALARLKETDREVLILRHLEGLSNGEVAQVLQLDSFAASKRYLRALARLKNAMTV